MADSEHTEPTAAAEAAADVPAEQPPAVAPAAAEEAPSAKKRSRKSELQALATALPAAAGDHPKRERKQAVDVYKVEEKKQVEVAAPQQGNGTKIGDIPNARFKLLKVKSDDDVVTGLHSLILKRPGKAHERKRNIFEFSGFVFSNEEERGKVRGRLESWTTLVLHGALDAFDLPRGSGPEGHKSAKVARLLAFLEEPKVLGSKDMAAQAAKAKEQAQRKREKEAAAKDKGRAAKKAPARKKAKKAASGESEGGEAEEASEEGGAEPEAEDSEQQEGSTKSKAAAGRKQPASSSRAPARKRQKVAEGEQQQQQQQQQQEGGDAAAPADAPALEELRAWLDELLESADFNTLSMKQLMASLVEQRGAGVKAHRDYVKGYVGDYCARKLAEQGSQQVHGQQEAAAEDKAEEVLEAASAQDAQPAEPEGEPEEAKPAAARKPAAAELAAAEQPAEAEAPAKALALVAEPIAAVADVEMADQ